MRLSVSPEFLQNEGVSVPPEYHFFSCYITIL